MDREELDLEELERLVKAANLDLPMHASYDLDDEGEITAAYAVFLDRKDEEVTFAEVMEYYLERERHEAMTELVAKGLTALPALLSHIRELEEALGDAVLVCDIYAGLEPEPRDFESNVLIYRAKKLLRERTSHD